MKTVQQWLTELENGAREPAPAHGHELLISGATTVQCSQDRGVVTWTVNNRQVDRDTAGRALAFARAHPSGRFTDFHKG